METFAEQIHPQLKDKEEKTKKVINDYELRAELDELTGVTAKIDEKLKTENLSYSERLELERQAFRRKIPYAPYKYLQQLHHKDINHIEFNVFDTEPIDETHDAYKMTIYDPKFMKLQK